MSPATGNYDYQQLLAAARRQLLAWAPFATLIGTDVGTDTLSATLYDGAFTDGWVFQGIAQDDRPARDPNATGTSSVTLSCRTSWTSANTHNSAQFPQLRVTVWSDITRPNEDNGMISQRDEEIRCQRVSNAVISRFHDPGNNFHWWGSTADFPPNGVYVTKSVFTSAEIADVYNTDGLVKNELRFNLTV